MPDSGRTFGPYEVVARIGAGGMGEVYKVRDSRLDRIVALKTSREQFSDRFAREARAAAALNHPHIATLHDVGPDYLVMEFVEGETLRGPLPAARALLYARQILDALEAAHRKGIVHCDLKPANIMVAKTGIKLLDFGLAQVKQRPKLDDNTATMTIAAEPGIAGTLQYMAPEQLQGKPADARTDIFAFGLVLYEMLTGRRAFEADNAASVISAIMTAEPPRLPETAGVASPGVERIIRQCLAKDPDERWQSAADVKHALDLVEVLPASDAGPAALATPRIAWRWTAGALVLGVLIGLAAMRLNHPAPAEQWTYRPLTYSGRSYNPVLSPDGKQVAYLWTGDKTTPGGVVVQLVSGGNPLVLPIHEVRGRMAWSPEGGEIAFATEAGLNVMPALGGASRRIAAFPPGKAASDLAWSPGGKFFVADGLEKGISVISIDGDIKPLTTPPAGFDRDPAISPDGRSIAFARQTATYNSTAMIQRLKSDGTADGDPRAVTTGVWVIGGLDWTSDGQEIVYEGSAGTNNLTLWRIPAAGGKATRLNMPSMIAGGPSIARRSDRMVYMSGQYETRIFKMPLNPRGEPQPLIEAIGDHRDLAVSPDGSRIVFTSNRTGSKELWTAKADGSNQTQLTYFNGPSMGSPCWSPDNRWIAFDGAAGGSSDIYIVPAEGGKPVRLTSDPGNEVRPSWSHDGRWIYYGRNSGGEKSELWKMNPTGGDATRVTDHGYAGRETPDGEWLYVAAPPKIVRMRPDGSQESLVTADLPGTNFWTTGGRNVYMLDGYMNLLRFPFGASKPETVSRFSDAGRPEGGGTAIAVPSDESYAIYRSVARSVNILMLIEPFR